MYCLVSVVDNSLLLLNFNFSIHIVLMSVTVRLICLMMFWFGVLCMKRKCMRWEKLMLLGRLAFAFKKISLRKTPEKLVS